MHFKRFLIEKEFYETQKETFFFTFVLTAAGEFMVGVLEVECGGDRARLEQKVRGSQQ